MSAEGRSKVDRAASALADYVDTAEAHGQLPDLPPLVTDALQAFRDAWTEFVAETNR